MEKGSEVGVMCGLRMRGKFSSKGNICAATPAIHPTTLLESPV